MATKRKRGAEKAAVEQQPRLEYIRPEGYQSVYVNNAQAVAGPFDIRIDFGDAEPAEGVIRVNQRVQIVMSHQHAAAFLQVLSTTMQQLKARIEQARANSQQQQ